MAEDVADAPVQGDEDFVWDLSSEPEAEGEGQGEEATPDVGIQPTPAASPDGRARDPQTGKFIPKAAESTTDGSAAPAPSGEAAPTAAPAAPAASSAPATAPAAAPGAPTPGSPFVFKGDGQEYVIEGSVHNPDGTLTIPANYLPVVSQILAEGMAHRGSFREELAQRDYTIQDLGYQLEQAQTAKSAREVKADFVLKHFAGLMDAGPDATAEWLDELAANRAKLELDAERAALDADRAAWEAEQERGQQAMTEQEQQELLPQLGASFGQHLVTATTDAWPGLFTQPELESAYEYLTQNFPDRLWYRADEDIPELGVAAGEIILDADFVEGYLSRQAAVLGRVQQTGQQTADRVTRTLQTNARLGVQAVPVKANQPVPAATPAAPTDWTRKMTKDEFEAEFKKGSPFPK